MEWIIEISTTIGIFALALLILVFFHELGHFLAAKLFGMRVERFSVGFPPRIWGFQKGDTDYCIGATPLGGYVKISGMIDESMDTEYLEEEPQPWEFRSKPVWQRIVVITAGVVFNMILAVMIFAGIALTNGDSKVRLDSLQGIYVPEGSVAAEVGFQTGDRLVGVNGEQVPYFDDLVSPSLLTRDNLSYTVIRGGQEVTIPIPDTILDEINKRGFLSLLNALPSTIGNVLDDHPAGKAGIETGDKVVAVDGEPVAYWIQLVEHIQNSKDEMTLTVQRGGHTMAIQVAPNEDNMLGISAPDPNEVFNIEHLRYGFAGALNYGIDKSAETLTGIVQGFGKMFSGDISVRENLGGPVAIANVTKQATDAGGWLGFWRITAFLSITLAIMNILPIPVLDGGHLMFLIYEGVTRREPSAKVRMALQQIGFILIIALFIFVTFNDIIKQFG